MNELKPSATAYGTFFRRNLLIAVPLLLVLSLINGYRNPAVFFVALPIGLLLGAGGVLLYFAVTRVYLEPDAIVKRNLLGVTTRIPLIEIGEVFQVHSLVPTASPAAPHLWLIGRDGRPLLRVRGEFWSLEQMHAVARHGVTRGAVYNPWEQAIIVKAFVNARPGLLPVTEARPVLSAVLIVLGVIVVLAAIIVPIALNS